MLAEVCEPHLIFKRVEIVWTDQSEYSSWVMISMVTCSMRKSHKSHNPPVSYPTIYHFATEKYIFLSQLGVLWDMGQVHFGICEIVLFWNQNTITQFLKTAGSTTYISKHKLNLSVLLERVLCWKSLFDRKFPCDIWYNRQCKVCNIHKECIQILVTISYSDFSDQTWWNESLTMFRKRTKNVKIDGYNWLR